MNGAPTKPPPTDSQAEILIQRLWWLFFALCVLFWLLKQLHVYTALEEDAAVYLYCAQQLLDGRIMFIDLFEINPPLISYISIAPLLLAQALGMTNLNAFIVFTVGLAAQCLLACSLILKRAASARDWLFIGPMLATMLLVFAFDRNYDFGEREQFFVLLYLPFFILRWRRMSGGAVHPALALSTGSLAGLGTALKPHFLLIAAAVELCMLYQDRRWLRLRTPELAGFAVTSLAYLLHLIFGDSQAASTFWNLHIPQVIKYYLPSERCPLGSLLMLRFSLARPNWLFPLTVILMPWALALRGRSTLIAPLLTWIASAYLIFVMQGKGCSYQAIPLKAADSLLLGLLLPISIDLLAARSTAASVQTTGASGQPVDRFLSAYVRLQVVAVVLLIGLCAAAQLGNFFGKGPARRAERYPAFNTCLLQMTRPGDAVALLGHDSRFVDELLLDRHLRAGWRYSWGYPVGFFDEAERAARSQEDKNRIQGEWLSLIKSTQADLSARKPTLIFLETAYNRSPISLSTKLNELGLLSRITRGYQRRGSAVVGIAGDRYVWDVYQRKPGAETATP